ncbi:MAG: hypothetical protein KKB51_11370 [Candidatus Riflebacteria bacterium]|nr:hypothetical protein [Candidatus Riflebacteria bacterium]
MNILGYMEQIRRLMADRGVCEVPQYPEPLAQTWFHPDILLSARGSGPAHCFCFQTAGCGRAFAGAGSCIPSLVWLMDCSEKDFSAPAADFIGDLHFAITNNREDSGFSLVAERRQRALKSARGCCWQLYYNGVSCGQIFLFSELFFQPLARSAVILVLDLARLPGLLEPENHKQPVLWTDKAAAADILALRVWRLRAAFDAGELIQQKQADNGLELCRQISLLNSSYLNSAKDEETLRLLSVGINDTLQQLVVERSTCKVVGGNADK